MNPNDLLKGLLVILSLNVQHTVAQELPAYLPQEGLIGWWPFNGNVMDESGNENNGAILGLVTPTEDRHGEPNKAYEFPGNASSFIDIDYNHTFNDLINGFSLSAWYWSDQSRTSGRVLALGDSDNHLGSKDNAFHITGFPNTGIMLRVPDEGSLFGNWGEAVSNQEANTWHHLVLSVNFSDSTWVIYYNGNEIERDTAPSINNILPLSWKGKTFNIGRKAVAAFDAWDGKIDDIGIWNRALSAEEVERLYTEVLESPTLCRDLTTVELLCTDLPRFSQSTPDCSLTITPNPNALGGEITGFTYGGFFNGHHYYVYNEPTNWTTGDSITRANGGYLTCIGSEEENAFVAGLTSNNIWIGFYRNPETCEYQWVNCEEVAYTKWATSEPNNQPCGEPYVQIINGCGNNKLFWNNLGNNSANGDCHSNMVPIMEVNPADYLPSNPEEDDLGIEAGTDNWNLFFEDSLILENVLTVQPDSSYQLQNLGTLAEVDDCGEGTVIRSYRVFSADEGSDLSDTCSMTVNFSAVHHYSILVPEDQVVTTCGYPCTNEALLIDFNECELSNSGFFPVNLDNPNGSISAHITDNGFDGCGVSIIRPTGLVSNQRFGYGTYTLRARSGSSISNQGLSLLVSEEDYSDRAIVADVRQKGTDDGGWAFFVQGIKVAEGPANTVPTNYPDWYRIRVRVTPDSLTFYINNTLMYESTEHTIEGACGSVLIGTYANSLYDDFEYVPYEENYSSEAATITNLEVSELGCDMINIAYSDTLLSQEMGACYLIERKYRVINWCEYNGIGAPWSLRSAEDIGGAYRVEVEYQSSNESINVDDLTVIHFYNEMGVLIDSLVFGAYQEGTVESHTFLKSTESLDVPFSPGFFEYTQKIEIYDTTPPVIQELDTKTIFSNAQSNDDCLGRIQKEWSVIDSCLIAADWQIVSAGLDLNVSTTTEEFVSDQNILESLTKLDLYTLQIDAEVPLGQHVIEIAIADLCGNTAIYHFRYSVVDSLPPIPICHTDLEVSLENLEEFPLPSVEVSASSLLLSAGMDCSGVTPSAKAYKWDSTIPLVSESGIYLDLRDMEGSIVINFEATEESGVFHNIIIPEVDTFAENSGVTTLVLEGGRLYGPCVPYSNFPMTNLYIGNETVAGISTSGSKSNRSIVCEEGGGDWEDMVLTVDTGVFMRFSALDLLQMEAGFDQTLSEHLIFDCSELGDQLVLVVVSDEADNKDYCVTNIQISDSQRYCEEIAVISGLIVTEKNHPVQDVDLTLNSEASTKTDLLGRYRFRNLIKGNDYSVIPSFDGDWLEGVTTQDLLMITKHILVVENLITPYQLLAADVDGSGYISTYDIVQLRQLILQNKTNIETNKSWKFIPADFEFTDPSNPWLDTIPEFININNLQGYAQADFIAIKIGDVNLSRFERENSSVRRITPIWVEANHLSDGKSEMIFKMKEYDIEGFQFAIEFGVLKLVELQEGFLKEENFGKTKLDDGVLLVSWNGEMSDQVPELFSMVVAAPDGINPLNHITLLDEELRGEIYWTNGEIGAVGIKEVLQTNIQMWQNYPNPFRRQTTIEVYVPAAMEFEFVVHDIRGRAMQRTLVNARRGTHKLTFQAHILSNSGVYFYSIIGNEFHLTKKMIIQR
jgi:hypothetical protein